MADEGPRGVVGIGIETSDKPTTVSSRAAQAGRDVSAMRERVYRRAQGAAAEVVLGALPACIPEEGFVISRPEYIAAALGRALHWVEDHPPANGPTLGEAPRARKAICKNGHENPERYANGQCKACDRERRKRA